MGIHHAALALIGGALFAPPNASATSIEFGTVIATFDESSFNTIGNGQLSGVGRITFLPGPSVFADGGTSSVVSRRIGVKLRRRVWIDG